MVTTELNTVEIVTDTYVPTVSDKIQRVLYRLDHGEPLVADWLKHYDNFCVLGLFADESGIGNWNEDCGYIISDTRCYDLDLPEEIVSYYGFFDTGASFDPTELSNDLQNKIQCLIYESGDIIVEPLYISLVNDMGLKLQYPYINKLLADIIRAGAIFAYKI